MVKVTILTIAVAEDSNGKHRVAQKTTNVREENDIYDFILELGRRDAGYSTILVTDEEGGNRLVYEGFTSDRLEELVTEVKGRL